MSTAAATEWAGDIPVTDALEQWHTAAGPSIELQSVSALTPTRMAVVLADMSGQTVALLGPGTRQVHPVPAGQIVQNVHLVGDSVVFDTAAPDGNDYWITRWSPSSGEVTLLYSSTGALAEFSETALDGTDLYLTAHDDGSRACIKRMDLTEPDPGQHLAIVTCVDPGFNINWPRVTHKVLSYLSGTRERDCAILHRVILPSGPDEVPNVDGRISRGIADDRWVVWTEPPPIDPEAGAAWYKADLRVQVGGTRYDLGAANAGSTRVCGRALYWTWNDPEPPMEPEQIRRWAPGGPVEVLYRSPDRSGLDAYATSSVTCWDGGVGFQRFGWWGSAGQEFLTNTALDWTPDLDPAGPPPA